MGCLFQSAPPRRGRHPRGRRSRCPRRSFNPRPREGGDAIVPVLLGLGELFQSAPPRRGRPAAGWGSPSPSTFQSAPPRRGRPPRIINPRVDQQFQSAPPRRGRHDTIRTEGGAEVFQSAPPRRGRPAPSVICTNGTRSTVFQSAPPRRGRPGATAASVCGGSRFNPRPREGGDLGNQWTLQASEALVSIRAPAKGATLVNAVASAPASTHVCFNPRPREGGDRHASSHCATAQPFQSAPPRRGRLGNHPGPIPAVRRLFQSAPPRRGRLQYDICLKKNVKLSRSREPGCHVTQTSPRKVCVLMIIYQNQMVKPRANQAATAWGLQVRALSEYQRAIRIIGGLVAHVVYPRTPIGAEPIKSQAVHLLIYLVHQPCAQHRPLRWVDLTLEHRILNPLSEILAQTSDPTQPPPSCRISGRDVVGDEHQHKWSYRQRNGGYPSRSLRRCRAIRLAWRNGTKPSVVFSLRNG